MAHFAKVEDNIVTDVIVIPNEVLDDNGVESEALGQNYINNTLGLEGTWLQTSYNNNIRSNYAGIGYTYDSENDVFLRPKPYDSWILNSDNQWTAPVAEPEYDRDNPALYNWNESTLSWDVDTSISFPESVEPPE
tara:strand:+ start:1919 stop:2323 length:405 start_codon:yes stop_codon:yes gene_type:complete